MQCGTQRFTIEVCGCQPRSCFWWWAALCSFSAGRAPLTQRVEKKSSCGNVGSHPWAPAVSVFWMDQYICQLLPSRAYSYSFHCCRGQHRKSSCSIKVWEWRKVSLGLYILDDGENTAASLAVVLNQKYNASFACNVEIWGASHCSYSLQLSHMETFNVMCVQIWSSVPFEFVRSTLLTDFWHENPPKGVLLLKSDRSNEHHWQPNN